MQHIFQISLMQSYVLLYFSNLSSSINQLLFNMIGQVKFDTQIKRFITMAIEIWPSFRSGLKHIDQIEQPPKESMMPRRDYNTMDQKTFSTTIVNDLFEYIMNYDVTADDIEDYLADILDMLSMEQQLSGGSSNPASYVSMSKLTIEIMKELQQGKNTKLVQFQQGIYKNVKSFTGKTFETVDRTKDADQCCQDFSGCSDQQSQQQQQETHKHNQKKETKTIKKCCPMYQQCHKMKELRQKQLRSQEVCKNSQQEVQGDWQQEQQDYQQTQEEKQKREAQDTKKAQQEAKLKQQADLEDDGWTIVRKK